MTKSVFSSAVLIVLMVHGAVGEIPTGFELVQITNDPDHEYPPRMNNCGEIVFSKRMGQGGDTTEVFLYDNGPIKRLTSNDVLDSQPRINDAGTIVWTHGFFGDVERLYVVVLRADVPTQWTLLGVGSGAVINNRGHVAWHLITPAGCALPTTIFFWDGETTVQVSDDDGLSHQSVALNDHDELVWTRYEFCPEPWESDILLEWGSRLTPMGPWPWQGQIALNPPEMLAPQVVRINNLGQVAWSYDVVLGEKGIAIWENGQIDYVTDWGRNPVLNNLGEMAFSRWYEDDETYQVWLYSGGALLQITDDSARNIATDINDFGEIVIKHGTTPEGDLSLLRRVRDGDVDFDGDVDADDLAFLNDCFTGPNPTDRLCECRFCDLDHDRDVDDDDLITMQGLMTPEDPGRDDFGRRPKRRE